MAANYIVSWVNPTKWEDDSAYGQADNIGYQLDFDATQPAVSVPLAWGTSFDMKTLAAFQALKRGTHNVSISAVAKGGIVGLVSANATFSVESRPAAPTSVAVA